VQDIAHRALSHCRDFAVSYSPAYFTGGVTPAPVVEPLSAVVVFFVFFSFLTFLPSGVDSVFVVVVVVTDFAGGVVALVDWSLQPTLSTGTTAIAAMLT
jgi:hypothetical protein